MISYNTTIKKYTFKEEDIDKIINYLRNERLYDTNNFTKDKITEFINLYNQLLANRQTREEEVTLERRETEEEAREYFGEDFIRQFDELLTELDKQQTTLAIHGTNPGSCESICEEGLQSLMPNLTSTAIQQHMEFGAKECHHKSYEDLLNWKHKNYKGLVLIALPYECYYKEGIWNHFQNQHGAVYGIPDYKINPDFIYGYIDVENKKIVLNPKYNRNHNYEGLIPDGDVFREDKEMDNEQLAEFGRKTNEDSKNYNYKPSYEVKNELITEPEELRYSMDGLVGSFNALKIHNENGVAEDIYESLVINNIQVIVDSLKAILPDLKEYEEIKEASKKYDEVFGDETNIQTQTTDPVDWGDEFEWEGDFNWSKDFDFEEDESKDLKL